MVFIVTTRGKGRYHHVVRLLPRLSLPCRLMFVVTASYACSYIWYLRFVVLNIMLWYVPPLCFARRLLRPWMLFSQTHLSCSSRGTMSSLMCPHYSHRLMLYGKASSFATYCLVHLNYRNDTLFSSSHVNIKTPSAWKVLFVLCSISHCCPFLVAAENIHNIFGVC